MASDLANVTGQGAEITITLRVVAPYREENDLWVFAPLGESLEVPDSIARNVAQELTQALIDGGCGARVTDVDASEIDVPRGWDPAAWSKAE